MFFRFLVGGPRGPLTTFEGGVLHGKEGNQGC